MIGVTGQFSAIDGLLSGRENLMLMADLHHLPRARGHARAQELLEQFDLVDAADKPAVTYSGGMKRRLDLAMTLVGSPRVIFLDEPTTGLDPRSRRTMWEVIRALAAGGVTIFLTTQYLDEADELADQIAVLDHGTIVASGTPEELKRRLHGGHISLRFADARSFAAASALLDVRDADDETLTLQVPSDGTVPTLRALLTRLDEHAIEHRRPVHPHPRPRRRLLRRHRIPMTYALTDSTDDAAPQPAAHASQPRHDAVRRRDPDRPPAAVRLRLRRDARRRAARRHRPAAAPTPTTSPPACCSSRSSAARS